MEGAHCRDEGERSGGAAEVRAVFADGGDGAEDVDGGGGGGGGGVIVGHSRGHVGWYRGGV